MIYMADNINVSPTPIQRNSADVAIELVQLHVRTNPSDADILGDLYKRYYAISETLRKKNFHDLEKLLPDNFYPTKSRV